MSARTLEDATRSYPLVVWCSRLARFTFVTACLTIGALCLLYVAFIAFGDVFGYQLAQTRGTSMEPFLQHGDLVLLRSTDADEVEVGDIVLFEQRERLILHRTTATHSDPATGVVIEAKGDNNAHYDAPVAASAVRATLVTLLPLRPLTDFYTSSYGDLRFVLYGTAWLLAIWRLHAILRQRRQAATA